MKMGANILQGTTKNTKMGKPKKRRTSAKKRKGSVVVRQKASVRTKRKKSGNNDTLPIIQGRPPADVAPTFRVKIRKKK